MRDGLVPCAGLLVRRPFHQPPKEKGRLDHAFCMTRLKQTMTKTKGGYLPSFFSFSFMPCLLSHTHITHTSYHAHHTHARACTHARTFVEVLWGEDRPASCLCKKEEQIWIHHAGERVRVLREGAGVCVLVQQPTAPSPRLVLEHVAKQHNRCVTFGRCFRMTPPLPAVVWNVSVKQTNMST